MSDNIEQIFYFSVENFSLSINFIFEQKFQFSPKTNFLAKKPIFGEKAHSDHKKFIFDQTLNF